MENVFSGTLRLRDGEGDRDVCSLVWLPLDLI